MAQVPDFVAVEHRVTTVRRNEDPLKRYFLAASIVVAVGALLIAALFVAVSRYVSARENTANATIESNVVQVSSSIPGLIKEILVHENEAIKKDQIIARMDSAELNLRERQAATSLAMARQQSESARQAVAQIAPVAQLQSSQMAETAKRVQETFKTAPILMAKLKKDEHAGVAALAAADRKFADISAQYDQLMVSVNQGQFDPMLAQKAGYLVQQARAKREDANRLLNDVLVQQQQIQEAVAEAQAARAALASEDNRLIQKQLATAQHQLAVALTSVKQAELELEQARLASYNATIVAPVDGVVAHKVLSAGQRVQPGQPIVAIVEPEMWVVADFDEKQVGRIEPKQRVAIRVAGSPNRTVVGRVKSLAPVVSLYRAPAIPPMMPAHASTANLANSPGDGVQSVSRTEISAEAKPEWTAARSLTGPIAAAAPAETGNVSTQSINASPATKAVRTVPVKIEFDPESLKTAGLTILPGMSASVSIDLR